MSVACAAFGMVGFGGTISTSIGLIFALRPSSPKKGARRLLTGKHRGWTSTT